MSEGPAGGKERDELNDLLDLSFDPEGLPPPLRPPALSPAQLQLAIELGFSNKFLPSDVPGVGNNTNGGGGNGNNPHYNNYNNDAQQHVSDFAPSAEYSQQHFGQGNGQDRIARQNEEEGLLEPLRRPHINEVPPDVLAVLLKNTRFEEIIGPSQRQQNQAQQHSNTEYQYNQQDSSRMRSRNQPNPSRNYQQSSNPQQSQNSQMQAGRYQNQSNLPQRPIMQQQGPPSRQDNSRGNWNPNNKRFEFNPVAKEFQPRPRQPDYGMINYSQDHAQLQLAEAVAQIQMQNMNLGNVGEFSQDSFSGQSSLNDDNTDCILTTLTDSINDVSANPANFNRCAKAISGVLKAYLADVETLGIVVTLLVEQSISNPNFCYSGARLANFLHKDGIAVGNVPFKTQFLSRLQEEFTSCVNNMENYPEIVPRCRGVLLFFGELYMNMRIEKAGVEKPLDILGLGMTEMMQRLVTRDPTHENVKCVFQVMKLVGWEIENSGGRKLQEEFEKTMKDLSYICVSNMTIKPQTKLLLETLFELRSKKWNREAPVQDASSSPVASSLSNIGNSKGNDDVYELPESDEDDFDDSCLMIDDEPEEVQKAFDDFLRMSKKK